MRFIDPQTGQVERWIRGNGVPMGLYFGDGIVVHQVIWEVDFNSVKFPSGIYQ